MPELIRPDICVLGASAGGLRAAMVAAAFGVPVALVDKGEMGRDTIKAGRLPLTALIAAGKRAHVLTRTSAFGIDVRSIEVDFARVLAHVEGVIAAAAPNVTRERLAGLGVRMIKSDARFKDRTTLVAGNDLEIAARRFIIATGSSPAWPPIPGIEATPHLTVETVFDLAVCPEHLIVLGAGALGLEFAQAFRRLGAAVTVLDAVAPLANELPGYDPECVETVLDQLAREGIALRTGTIGRIEPGQAGGSPRPRVILRGADGEETVEGSHLLIAGWRWANVVGLGLDAAGIKFDERGIAVDKGLRTTNRRVYAIGDVTGRAASAHSADQQADLVMQNALFRRPVRLDPEAVPRVTFTDPELAQVGLTEAAARSRRHRIGALRWPCRENDRAIAERNQAGHIKVVTGRGGRILGVGIVGKGAGELITAWIPAIGRRGSIAGFAGMSVPYPTLADIGKRAAATYFIRGLTSPWLRRIIALVRRIG